MSAYYDLAARFPWPHAPERYGRGFRLGDRAVAYVRTLLWRTQHTHERLVAIDDLGWPECADAQEFGASWVFDGLADEILMLDPGQRLAQPDGTNLYDQNLWDFWKDLRFNPPIDLQVSIEPTQQAKNAAGAFPVPEPFILVQPLFDAAYNEWRNRDWGWWLDLINALASDCNVVVACHARYASMPRLHRPNVSYTWDQVLSPMEVLALAQRSALFVGGETGLTLWAPIMQVPTYGCFAQQSCNYRCDTAPMSFGKPVNVQPIEAPPELHAEWIRAFIEQYRLTGGIGKPARRPGARIH